MHRKKKYKFPFVNIRYIRTHLTKSKYSKFERAFVLTSNRTTNTPQQKPVLFQSFQYDTCWQSDCAHSPIRYTLIELLFVSWADRWWYTIEIKFIDHQAISSKIRFLNTFSIISNVSMTPSSYHGIFDSTKWYQVFQHTILLNDPFRFLCHCHCHLHRAHTNWKMTKRKKSMPQLKTSNQVNYFDMYINSNNNYKRKKILICSNILVLIKTDSKGRLSSKPWQEWMKIKRNKTIRSELPARIGSKRVGI